MQVGYKLRRSPQPHYLVRHLLRNILEVLQQSHRPMRDMEIILALATRHHRTDPDFQRQVRINLRDAVSYGILKRQMDVYSVRSKRLAEILDGLGGSRRQR